MLTQDNATRTQELADLTIPTTNLTEYLEVAEEAIEELKKAYKEKKQNIDKIDKIEKARSSLAEIVLKQTENSSVSLNETVHNLLEVLTKVAVSQKNRIRTIPPIFDEVSISQETENTQNSQTIGNASEQKKRFIKAWKSIKAELISKSETEKEELKASGESQKEGMTITTRMMNEFERAKVHAKTILGLSDEDTIDSKST